MILAVNNNNQTVPDVLVFQLGLPIRRDGREFPPTKIRKLSDFLSKFEILFEKLSQLPLKFRQKLGLSALFTLSLAESQIKVFFSMKSRRKSIIVALFFAICRIFSPFHSWKQSETLIPAIKSNNENTKLFDKFVSCKYCHTTYS